MSKRHPCLATDGFKNHLIKKGGKVIYNKITDGNVCAPHTKILTHCTQKIINMGPINGWTELAGWASTCVN